MILAVRFALSHRNVGTAWMVCFFNATDPKARRTQASARDLKFAVQAGESQFREETEHLDEGSADIIATSLETCGVIGVSFRWAEDLSGVVG